MRLLLLLLWAAPLLCSGAVAYYLDNTGSLNIGNPSGSSTSAGSGFYSIHRYGYSFRTGGTGFTLVRLDCSVNAATGGPFVVDFLVEVWSVSGPTSFAASPLYSAHAMGTVAASGTKSYTSLVLPATMVLSANTYYAVTFSMQTPASRVFQFYTHGTPTVLAGSGITLLNQARSSDNGASWTTSGTPAGFRLGGDSVGATYTGTTTWTDQTGGLTTGNLDVTAFSHDYNIGTNFAAIGITCPHDGDLVQYGLNTFSFVMCTRNGGSITPTNYQYTLSLVRADVTNGIITPAGAAVQTSGINNGITQSGWVS